MQLWCGKHQRPLDVYDGAPIFIPEAMEQEARHGSYQAVNGIWILDLSDVGCDREITEWNVGDQDDKWYVASNLDAILSPALGPFDTQDEAMECANSEPLDECVQTWEARVLPEEGEE